MKAIVTRPAAQAAQWVAQLGSCGVEAVALPLIGIEGPADPLAVVAAWRTLARQSLVVFVSPNAVERFFALRPSGAAWPAGVWAGSPGPGTSRELLRLGVPAEAVVAPDADAEQFDSESLWARLRTRRGDWHGAAVTIVRGDGGRDWLAGVLREAGAEVAHLSAYRRVAPTLDDAQRACLAGALAAPAGQVWLFSSSEAIDHLAELAPGADWRASTAIATHPRIAARAREAGFGRVLPCRPELDAVVACIQSIGPSA
jgi:uroporphyrinogen-III synthase